MKLPERKSKIKDSCQNDFASALPGKIFFSERSKRFFYIDQGPAIEVAKENYVKRTGEKETPDLSKDFFTGTQFHKSVLYYVSTRNWKAKRVTYIEIPRADTLLLTGSPENMVYTTTFKTSPTCKSGEATLYGVNFQLPPARRKITIKSGNFSIAHSTGASVIFDQAWGKTFELAAGTFQLRRSLFPIAAEERPIAISIENNSIISWISGQATLESPRGALVYKGLSTPEAKIRFLEGDKILWQDQKFAVLRPDYKKNMIKIIELRNWSGVAKTKEYEIMIPKEFNLEELVFHVDFATKHMIISGFTSITKKRIREAMLVNYDTAHILTRFEPESSNYIDEAMLSPGGEYAIFVERDLSNIAAGKIHIYSTAVSRWKSIDLANVD